MTERKKFKDVKELMDEYGVEKVEFTENLCDLYIPQRNLVGKYKYYYYVMDGTLYFQTVIGHDNIHMYYEFMSDEEKYKHVNILDCYYERCLYLFDALSMHRNHSTLFTWLLIDKDRKLVRDQIFFGVIDTFKPIDEYVADIKVSNEYKEQNSRFDIK